MSENKQLTARFAAVLAVAALVGTSAFADSRPSKETRSHADGRSRIVRDRAAGRADTQRSDNRAIGSPSASAFEGRSDRSAFRRGLVYDRRADDRNRGSGSDVRNWDRDSGSPSAFNRGSNDGYRSNERSNSSFDRNRNDSRGNGNWRGGNRGSRNGSYQNGPRYSARGRVSRIDHFRGGYHVWIGGVPVPFFVPFAFFQSHHFRVGLNVNLGGYYNPLGYYDYDDTYYGGSYYGGDYYGSGYYGGGYCGGDYGGGYYGGGASSAGALRGVVESVDFRRDTLVIRNDATGRFVTMEMRDRDSDDVRPGDYVELSGDWTRAGLFVAYDIHRTDRNDR